MFFFCVLCVSSSELSVNTCRAQNVTGETRRITEALLISAAQREAGVAEWMVRFSNQAARQQQAADAFDERLRVEYKTDVLAARSEMQRLEGAFLVRGHGAQGSRRGSCECG